VPSTVSARGHASDHGEHDLDARAFAAPAFVADDAHRGARRPLTANELATADLDTLASVTSVATSLSAALNQQHG
jgi:DNA-binding IclR family transcriptional regulator